MEVVHARPAPTHINTDIHARIPTIDIPQEVSDIIVDLLSRDARSLKSSALISRQWRDRSQYHLHHTLKLDRKSNIPSLVDIYGDNLLPHYVRAISIDMMWGDFWSMIWGESWSSLLPIFHQFDGVRSLSLGRMGPISVAMHEFVSERFACLDSLSLTCVSVENFSTFSTFLNALPHLAHLALKDVHWSKAGGEVSPSVHRLRTLRLAFCTEQSVFVKWLMSVGEDKLRLESLSLTWYHDSDSLRAFVGFVGGHLQHLAFSYVFSDIFSRDWRQCPLDLSPNTGLRTLEFQQNIMAPHVWGSLSTVPEMLSSVASSRLTTLCLHLTNLEEEPVPYACLSTIDAILDKSPFISALAKVNLFTDVSLSPENGREHCMERIQCSIHSAMPKALKKGLLRIGCLSAK
ncbi:hypothetical protein EUX98_g3987 [Antrodiella citrinella]|uniref:F-box domain-containing protein n=1 Tax=Antrodiella citrinella TaxID=2447956 RepID=A0A4S4MV88_9APHY|nr:hypothetical protein EUX98_g3987 [Antrodiella citrinella]